MRTRASAAPRLTVVAIVVALGAVASGETGETHQYQYVMGTSVEVQVFGRDEASRREAIAEAFAAFHDVDHLMSNYRADSELARVNRDAAQHAVTITDPLFAVLDAARRVSVASNGAFDVTVGPLMKLWGFHDKTPHVPTAAELAAIRPLVDYRNMRLDEPHHNVAFVRPRVELDLGGIAKGFAVEIAAQVLRRRGLDGFIDAGGNQYLLGTPPGKRVWTIGIENPIVPGQLLGALETGETSVSTSADSSNFLIAGNRRYGHILDPRTLEPSTASLSVTILSRDGTLADAMSKAAFVLGPKDGLALVDSFPGMAGVIAYGKPDGSIGVAMSAGLAAAYHPAAAAY